MSSITLFCFLLSPDVWIAVQSSSAGLFSGMQENGLQVYCTHFMCICFWHIIGRWSESQRILLYETSIKFTEKAVSTRHDRGIQDKDTLIELNAKEKGSLGSSKTNKFQNMSSYCFHLRKNLKHKNIHFATYISRIIQWTKKSPNISNCIILNPKNSNKESQKMSS